MAPDSSLSVHSCEDSITEEPKHMVKTVSSNLLLLSSEFFKPFKSNLQAKVAHPQTIEHLQSSILSISDRFMKSLHCFALQNPLLKSISSVKFHFAFLKSGCKDLTGVNSLSNHGFAAIIPSDSVAGLVVSNGTMNFLNIYNTLLVVRLVLTWFPNPPPAIVAPLSTICDPYLNIFRGLIPPIGGALDLSPILAFIVLNAITSAAAALPAELPSELEPKGNPVFCATTSKEKWMRRVLGNKIKASSPGAAV